MRRTRSSGTVLHSIVLALASLFAATVAPVGGQTVPEGGVAVPGPSPATGEAYRHDLAPRVVAMPLEVAPSIDGVLDEPFWARTPAISDLRQSVPVEGAPVSEATEVRIAYDRDALYVGALLHDRSPVATRLARRDAGVGDSDLFAILFDSYHDHETAYRFWTNPSGVKGDAIVTGNSTGGGDASWDPVWELATRVTPEGWSVEMRIPFSQLRFSPAEIQLWGIQVERRIHRNQENATFPFTPVLERGGVSRFAHLEGIEGIRSGRGLELLPYIVARGEYLQLDAPAGVTFGNPYRSGSDHFADIGLDLKYRITSNLTLDATVNPDFGQVELDPSEINLTAFETQFGERRPFFVEGADIFGFGEGGPTGSVGRPPDLVYSRRIGTAPRGSVPSGAVFSDSPVQTTIVGAGKLTGRLPGGWSLGILEAVTARETADYVDQEGLGHSLTVEPAANYFVARARRQIAGGRTRFGAIATAVNRDVEGAALAQLLHRSAYATGIDFAHESADRAWLFSGVASLSRVEADPEALLRTQRASRRYYQRPDATHLDLDPEARTLSGYYVMAYVGKQAGRFTMRNGFAAISPGYEVNDAGFHTNADRILFDTHYQWTDRDPGRFLRSWNVSGSPDAVWNFDGNRTFANFNTQLSLEFLNYWRSSVRLQWDPWTDDDRLTRGGPMARTPGRFDARFTVNSDGRRSAVLGANVGWNEDDAGGSGRSGSANVNFRPSEAIQLRVAASYSSSQSVAQYITRIADPLAEATFEGRYVFAGLDRTTVSLQTNLNVTFSPTLSLQLYVEPFISTGKYGALKELLAPGTFEFREYGTEIGTLTVDAAGRSQVDPDGEGPSPGFSVSNRDFSARSLLGNAVLRWEWRPGSTLFLVWQQRRVNSFTGRSAAAGTDWVGNFDLGRDIGDLFTGAPENILMVKMNYWFSR